MSVWMDMQESPTFDGWRRSRQGASTQPDVWDWGCSSRRPSGPGIRWCLSTWLQPSLPVAGLDAQFKDNRIVGNNNAKKLWHFGVLLVVRVISIARLRNHLSIPFLSFGCVPDRPTSVLPSVWLMPTPRGSAAPGTSHLTFRPIETLISGSHNAAGKRWMAWCDIAPIAETTPGPDNDTSASRLQNIPTRGISETDSSYPLLPSTVQPFRSENGGGCTVLFSMSGIAVNTVHTVQYCTYSTVFHNCLVCLIKS